MGCQPSGEECWPGHRSSAQGQGSQEERKATGWPLDVARVDGGDGTAAGRPRGSWEEGEEEGWRLVSDSDCPHAVAVIVAAVSSCLHAVAGEKQRARMRVTFGTGVAATPRRRRPGGGDATALVPGRSSCLLQYSCHAGLLLIGCQIWLGLIDRSIRDVAELVQLNWRPYIFGHGGFNNYYSWNPSNVILIPEMKHHTIFVCYLLSI